MSGCELADILSYCFSCCFSSLRRTCSRETKVEHRETKDAEEEGKQTRDDEFGIIAQTHFNTTERPQSPLHVDKAELREKYF